MIVRVIKSSKKKQKASRHMNFSLSMESIKEEEKQITILENEVKTEIQKLNTAVRKQS